MLEQLLDRYGYLAVLVGTFFEGETVVVLASFAAHRGYLRLDAVIISAFLGSVLGDQLYFHIGRRWGRQFLERRPRWQSGVDRALGLLERHTALFILSFRFLYGLRTVSSFAVGLTNVGALRFTVLNGLGALVWASALGAAGFLLGEGLELFLKDLAANEPWIFASILVLGVLAWSLRRTGRRVRGKSPNPASEVEERAMTERERVGAAALHDEAVPAPHEEA